MQFKGPETLPKAAPTDKGKIALPTPPRLRTYLVIVVVLVAGYLVVGGLSLYSSWAERNERLERLRETAAGLSGLLDREVEAARALLVGLSISPHIASGDFAAFHDQLLRTPHPEGAALVLSDREKQLVNALVPYGTELPQLSFFKPQPGFFERLEAEDFHVSSRIIGRFQASPSTVISVKVPGPDGRLRYFLSLGINNERLLDLLLGDALPEGVGLLVIDAMGQDIAERQPPGMALPSAELMAKVHRDPDDLRPTQGLFTGADTTGTQIWTAFARSGFTGWTASASQPADAIDGTFRDTLRLLVGVGLLLAAALVALPLLWRRRVEAPFASMEHLLDDAYRQIVQTRRDVEDAQQQEQRRIAQELHDTTAQHLVAADMHLSALRRGERDLAELTASMAAIQELIEQSLRELRTFAFLLRPDSMDSRPFRETFENLFSTYAARAGLKAEIDISAAADTLPSETQHTLFRVAREAMTNIHRHAKAKQIAVRLVPAATGWELDIRDDGVGGITFPPNVPQSGLGVRGMSDAIAALRGTLTITDVGAGTWLRATIPVSVTTPASPEVAVNG